MIGSKLPSYGRISYDPFKSKSSLINRYWDKDKKITIFINESLSYHPFILKGSLKITWEQIFILWCKVIKILCRGDYSSLISRIRRTRSYATIFHASTNRLIEERKIAFYASRPFLPHLEWITFAALRCSLHFRVVSLVLGHDPAEKYDWHRYAHYRRLLSPVTLLMKLDYERKFSNRRTFQLPLNFYRQLLLNVWTCTLWFHFESRFCVIYRVLRVNCIRANFVRSSLWIIIE